LGEERGFTGRRIKAKSIAKCGRRCDRAAMQEKIEKKKKNLIYHVSKQSHPMKQKYTCTPGN
jgi:hypothetical protein